MRISEQGQIYPRIPYGWSDFRAIRLENRLYVDKTRFIYALEEERYALLIRPRRFGKSCWISLLENYYDRRAADEFEAIFGGTDLGGSRPKTAIATWCCALTSRCLTTPWKPCGSAWKRTVNW